MKLVYRDSGKLVKIGDEVNIMDDQPYVVTFFNEPHKPASTGKVTVSIKGTDDPIGREFYVGSIGAEWVDREDR